DVRTNPQQPVCCCRVWESLERCGLAGCWCLVGRERKGDMPAAYVSGTGNNKRFLDIAQPAKRTSSDRRDSLLVQISKDLGQIACGFPAGGWGARGDVLPPRARLNRLARFCVIRTRHMEICITRAAR